MTTLTAAVLAVGLAGWTFGLAALRGRPGRGAVWALGLTLWFLGGLWALPPAPGCIRWVGLAFLGWAKERG